MNIAFRYCQDKTVQSGSSFYFSFFFLPILQRRAITAVYAFCREVDDIVDRCTDRTVARKNLTWWREEIQRVYAAKPVHPVGIALNETIQTFNLKQSIFEDIISGMEMDLYYQQYRQFSDLQLYCYRAASTVGLLAAEIFGYKNLKTLEFSKQLGVAFQLVNIIRDIGEDARRNRIYIPGSDLKQCHISSKEIITLTLNSFENFKLLMATQINRARLYYQSALDMLPDIDRINQRSALIMAKIYFTILDEIEASNFSILHQRITITPIRKLWIAWETACAENKRFQKLVTIS